MGKKQDSRTEAEQKRAIDDTPERVDQRFWVREDGALCWGDGCLVIKPDGKDLRISIDESACGELALEAYGKTIQDTIGRGGKTVYEVPGKIEHDEPVHSKPKTIK